MPNKTGSDTVMMSLMAGLAGAVVALLFAPRSGEETRNQLKKQANAVKEDTRKQLQSAKAVAKNKKEELRGLKDRLAKAVSKSGDQARQAFEEEQKTAKDEHAT